jgi:hypothetical protein
MEFVKKHYEKILLGAVLVGLLFGLVFLPLYIIHDRQEQEQYAAPLISPPAKPLPPLDMTLESNVVQRLQSPYKLDFDTTNKLFNPVQWQRTVSGRLIKIAYGNEVGPRAVKVAKITPLYFTLTLESVETNQFGTRYAIGVERQAAAQYWLRNRRAYYASVGEKNEAFTLKAAQGPADNPELTLQLADTGETVTLSKKKPFRRVDGYTADLKYGPEGKSWSDQRVGADLKFAGGEYIIVAIDRDQVVLSDRSNEKKTTLLYDSK